jgi:hypothetical protein
VGTGVVSRTTEPTKGAGPRRASSSSGTPSSLAAWNASCDDAGRQTDRRSSTKGHPDNRRWWVSPEATCNFLSFPKEEWETVKHIHAQDDVVLLMSPSCPIRLGCRQKSEAAVKWVAIRSICTTCPLRERRRP